MPVLQEEIEIRSEEVQEILSQIPNWMIRWGSLFFLIIIIMILFLSYLIKYPDVITADSVISTTIPPEKIYARSTEKIAALLVTDTLTVNRNTPLAVLTNTADYRDVFFLKSITDTISINTVSFHFPIEKIGTLSLGDITPDYAVFKSDYSQYILHKELKPFRDVQNANKLSVKELKKRIQNTIVQKTISKKELDLLKKDVIRYQKLFNKGVISMQELEVKKLALLQAEKNYQTMNSTISQLKEAASTANKEVKSTYINKIKEHTSLFNNVIQSFNQLKKTIKNWELNYLLKSNSDGQISFMNTWSVHQNVNAGDPMFTIVPAQNNSYIAQLKAPSQNSGKIKIGQTVNIKLENYPHKEYGMLKGSVHKISLLPDQEGLYSIEVILPERLETTYDKNIVYKPEMRGTATIITEDLRLIERFFYQLQKVLDQ